ncbi:MAG TPA: tryptophan synthase subunit beta [Patescibacteria group bacterium]|nr:tryptophan synthase subunit beta [Patescibacteria group bacterium]
MLNGKFGKYGGRYVPEMLIPALDELETAFEKAKKDKKFQEEFAALLKDFCGRPTPLTFAENLTKKLGGAKIYLKNEGLNITGAHKITHCVGQVLLAKHMGKKRIIAETGAGQHGLASATVAAKFGMKCIVYMGEVDYNRQKPNVFSMEQLGAKVLAVQYGNKTLKDAVNAALKDWIENVEDSYYMLGSVLGPHPYPSITKYFQSVVGREVKAQIREHEGKLPDVIVACISGGSNALGIFAEFLEDERIRLIGVEAGGKGKGIGENAIRFDKKTVGVVQGYKSYFIQDSDGQLLPTHSISAGLDYAGVGPEIANLFDEKRITMTSATDKEVVAAYQMLARTEGIIPALESSHAIAEVIKFAPTLPKNKIIVVNLSGRGDKDLFIVAKAFKDRKFEKFLKEYLEEYNNED